MKFENLNQNNPSPKRQTPEEIKLKKLSLMKKFGGVALGLAAAAISQMPTGAMAAEKAGVITPDMQPTSNQVKTQDGAILPGQNLNINPTTSIQGPETLDGSALNAEINPSQHNENFQSQPSNGEQSLENYNMLPEEMKPVTGEPMDDIPETYTPGDPVNIGPAYNPDLK
jgi:hypothetical protein